VSSILCVLHPLSSVLCPTSSILCPLSSVLCPLSSILCPLTNSCRTDMAIRGPSTTRLRFWQQRCFDLGKLNIGRETKGR
jgi:hypothetical protein